MAKQTVNLGTIPNSGLDGDDARTAFTKVNENFGELYTAMGGAGGTVSPKLTAVANSVWAANQLLMASGANTLAMLATGTTGRALIGAANAAAGRTALALGTASTSNVTASVTDNTVGNILKVGDFGLGANSSVALVDANTPTGSGFYLLATTSAGGLNGPPQIGTVGWFILHQNHGTGAMQIASPATGVAANKARLFHRQQFGGVWSDWKEFSDPDSVIAQLKAVGVANTDYNPTWPNTSLNNLADVPSGNYRTAGSTTDLPPGANTSNTIQYYIRNNTSTAAQAVQIVQGYLAPYKQWMRVANGGAPATPTWGAWQEFVFPDSPVFTGDPKAPTPATADNDTSISTTAFVRNYLATIGLGANIGAAGYTLDLDAITEGGLYAFGTTAVGAPKDASGNGMTGSLLHMSRDARPTQIAATYTSRQVWVRYFAGAWTAWELLGNSAVQSAGLNTDAAPAVTDLDATTNGGVYRYANTATGNPLASASGLLFVEGYSAGASGYTAQTVLTVQTTNATLYNRMFTRTRNQGTWGPWKEQASLDTLAAWGMGTTSAAAVTDPATIRTSGQYYIDAAAAQAAGLPVNVGHVINHVPGVSSVSAHVQYAYPSTSVAANRNRAWKRQLWSSAWSAWEEVVMPSTPLTGYAVGANSAVVSTDTLLAAIGKLQGQINATTPISKGGTGATTAAGARTNLGLGDAAVRAVVGDVAAGSALMSIVENSNGTVLRFANGMQVCILPRSMNVQTLAAAANDYLSFLWTFPASFSGNYYTVSAQFEPVNSLDHYGFIHAGSWSPSSCSLTVRNGATAQGFVMTAMAVGRWQ